MRSSTRQALTYALCYLMWVVSAALGLFDLVISRGLLMSLITLVSANRWVLSSIDRFGLILLGIAWLAFVIALEGYYRSGVDKGDLARRVGRVIAAELSVLALAYIVPFLIP